MHDFDGDLAPGSKLGGQGFLNNDNKDAFIDKLKAAL